jgi:hypothetical protein
MGQDAIMIRQMRMGCPEAIHPIIRQGGHREPIFLVEGDRGRAGVRGAAAGADDADDYTDHGPVADEQSQKHCSRISRIEESK